MGLRLRSNGFGLIPLFRWQEESLTAVVGAYQIEERIPFVTTNRDNVYNGKVSNEYMTVPVAGRLQLL